MVFKKYFWLWLGFFLISAGASQSPLRAGETTFGKRYTMLVVDSQVSGQYQMIGEARRRYLESHGYRQGQNLDVTHYSVDNNIRTAEIILKVALKNFYDVISLNGTIPAIAAKNVAYNNPQHKFIFACVTDPVGIGIIKDFLDPPPYNFTGVSCPGDVKSRLNFIRRLMPQVKTLGFIYADMPQSHSYRQWLEDLLKNDPEFKDIFVIFRQVPLITGEEGNHLMAESARKYVMELNDKVDIFLSPNDEMGAQEYFVRMVAATATKPLVGLGRADVMAGWGATMSLYPSYTSIGEQSGRMLKEVLEGTSISEILPEGPKENGVAFDINKVKQFGITVPIDMMEMAGENIVYGSLKDIKK
jgi:putative ABC transport system substrate-binding protein